MKYIDHIKDYIYEDVFKREEKKAKVTALRTGKMTKRDRVARLYSDAKKRGDDNRAGALLQIYKKLENIGEGKDWIQGAVKHPGRCTPMPNPDCPVGSPQYNLGKRFKKAARKKQSKGGTGWQGKV